MTNVTRRRFKRIFSRTTNHEHMVVPTLRRWGRRVSSLDAVLTVNTPLTPSQSDEDGF
jgi:hypothetical protein